MVNNLTSSVTQWCTSVNDIHQKVGSLKQMSLNEAENFEQHINDINTTITTLFKENQKELQGNVELLNKTIRHCTILSNDLELTQLELLYKGRVNCSFDAYMQNTPLSKRILILGCGHGNPPHSHEGQYCIDINPERKPDAMIDISSISMKYFRDESVSKIILEYLPTAIFNFGNANQIFSELYRILSKEGEVEFNNMFGLDDRDRTDFGNPFNLVLTREEMDSIIGKRLTEFPEICVKYNQKMADFFDTIGFQFPPDMDMKTMHDSYKLIKKVNQSSFSCTLL